MAENGHRRGLSVIAGAGLVLVLVACGGSSPAPASSADAQTEDDGGDEVILGVLVGNGASEPPPPPRAAARVPADRASVSDPDVPPALAEAERSFAEALATPLGAEEAAEDTRAAVARLSEQLRAASAAVSEALDRYRPFYDDERLGPVARTRSGDLLDAHAARVALANVALPLDLREATAEAAPDVRAEVERVFHDRIGEEMARRAEPLYCLAVEQYRAAGTERAQAQLARYGEAFVSHCAQTRTAPPTSAATWKPSASCR